MKKLLYHLLPALLLLPLFSCDHENCVRGRGDVVSETRAEGHFTGVEMRIDGTVHVAEGAVPEIRIEAYETLLPYIETDVRGDLLVIKTDDCVKASGGKTNVYITVPALTRLSVSGSGDIRMLDTFHSHTLDLKISGSGSIRAQAVTTNLYSSITGSGNINLEGTTVNHTATISGSGNLHAYSLPTDNCDIRVSGSGDAELHVLKNLSVSMSGSGNVRYKGSPVLQRASISGSGKIVKVS